MDFRDDIRRFVAATFFVPAGSVLGDDDDLLERAVIDSTGVLEVVHFLEETYGIRLDDSEILPENLGSIQRIADFVGRRTAPAAGERAAEA
jgi:acyl carrier protein